MHPSSSMLLHRTGISPTLRPLQVAAVRQRTVNAKKLVTVQQTPHGLAVPHQAGLGLKGHVTRDHRDIHVQSSSNPLKGALDDGSKSLVGNGYLVVALLYAALGVAHVAVPQKVAEAVSVSLVPFNEYLVRVLGLAALVLSVFAYSLKEATDSGGLLEGATYKRMAWWLVLHGALGAVVAVRSTVSLSTAVIAVKCAIPVILLGLYWKAYEELPLAESVTGTLSAAQDLLSVSNVKAGVFSALAALTFIKGVYLATVPKHMWEKFLSSVGTMDATGALLTRSVGLGVVTLSVAAYSLKDAADRGRLGAGPFRNITLALALLIGGGIVLGATCYLDVLKTVMGKTLLYVAFGIDSLLFAFLGYTYATEKGELSL